MTIVEINSITCEFSPRRKNSEPRIALNQVKLKVDSQLIFGLLGPNGGGKTTLFRILSTMLPPTSGSARIFGLDVQTQAAMVRRKIGVVFQHPSVDKKLTLRENLVHQGHLYGLRGPSLAQKIGEVSERFGINDRLNDFVGTLSGGLQRRVEIAKALLHEPSLLLMDEPSTGLDPGARRGLWEVLYGLKTSGVTILLTTHLMEEADKCDRLAILNHGRLVAEGTPLELKSRIGGDVIHIESSAPIDLCQKIKAKFGGEPLVVDDVVQLEKQDGHRFLPLLVEAFPGLVQSIKLGKPTLDDVFAKETGHTFDHSDWEEKKQ